MDDKSATSPSLIDPTVPLCGLPLECVHTAEWDIRQDAVVRNGETYYVQHKIPRLNGVSLHTLCSDDDQRRFILMFPRVASYVPETEAERMDRATSGRRSVLEVTINGARFNVPKGISVEVPTPIAEIIDNHLNPIRTQAMREHVGRPEFSPLDISALT